jgi:hypothetical protein
MADALSLRLSATVENGIVGNNAGVNDPLELLRRDRSGCFCGGDFALRLVDVLAGSWQR